MQVERALVESESRYRSLVENTTDWIWEINLDFEHTYSNRQLEVILGYTTEELQKLTLDQLLEPDDLPGFKARLLQLIAEESGWDDWVLRFRHKDGRCRYLESKARPVFDTDGNLCGYRGIDRDITEDVVSKQAIARSEQKYRTVVESANDAIWLFDGERFTDCNDKTLEILQRRRDEVIGKRPSDISPEFQPDGSSSIELASALVADVLEGNPRRFEWVHQRSDGTAVEMEISLTPIELAHDGARILAVGRDISENKRAQRKIERRANCRSLLAELSSELATASALEVVEKIDRFLPRIGAQYQLSGVSIWWISEGSTKDVDCITSWRRTQDCPLAQSEYADRNSAPWLVSEIAVNNFVLIDEANDWPVEASADRASFQDWDVATLLAFPRQVRQKVAGACIMVGSDARTWSTEDIQELKLLSDTMTGAYARCWAVEAISRREHDLERSQEIARVGNFSLEYDTPQSAFSRDGRFEMSSQCRQLFGIGTEPLTVELALERIHPDDRKRLSRNIEKGFGSNNRAEQAFRVLRPDGTTIDLRVQSEFDRDEYGNVVRFFGVAHDVTDYLEANRKIEDALAEIRKLKDQLQDENVLLREEISAAHGFGKIIGDSPALNTALRLAEKVAPTDLSVLILGETGTGKELIARAIHGLSRRKDSALVSVNCAALSKELIESELFGHEKGAFTGAHARRKGRFEVADGGTLFLDEIGELPGELQAKLLRVLQDGSFERLGGSETLHVDVRLIAATNKNLMRAVDRGEFRADLFYRINSFPVRLPPLRERLEDIPLLAEFLVQKHAKRMGKDVRSISARTLRYLCNREWPGNVRELEGIIQRALISTSGAVLDYLEVQSSEIESPADDAPVPAKGPANLRNLEREYILNVLDSTGWIIEGKRGAAAKMGLPPSTLRSQMERLQIKRTR
ncbi:MAG: sigma 54-interacting transcriptional regulator [Gammaproteobacteria bacterium]|nr:sigma 54-interacting transcriptional regulator [Gammaproteobacteria bacterium]